jgi:integrase
MKMARAVAPLTDSKIKSAKPKVENGINKGYTLADGNGLQLLVKPNGKKLWEFLYKSPTHPKRRKTSFGNYPQTSLKNARELRDKYKSLIIQGIDPIDNKKHLEDEVRKKQKGMFVDIVAEWLEKESVRTVGSTHKAKVRILNKDAVPYVKDKHISKITIDDIILILEEKQKVAPEIASRLFNYLDNLFRYAVLKRYCDRNILADIRKSDIIIPRQAKHMPKITDKSILKKLVNAIDKYKGSPSTRNCLRLVLHIPLRADNLCNLKWEYIDFEKQILTIPREEMKQKNINLEDFVMPLTDIVIKILEEQKSFTGFHEYVFLGRDHRKPINKESPNRALERLGFNDEKNGSKIRLHGFRGTFRSLVETLDVESKFSFEVKERALDHHDKSSIVRAYNNKANYFEQLKILMSWWSDYIMSLRVRRRKIKR